MEPSAINLLLAGKDTAILALGEAYATNTRNFFARAAATDLETRCEGLA